MRALYSSSRLPAKRQVIDIERYAEPRAALEQWEATLPESLQVSSQTSRSTFHQHLTHKQGILLLSRIMLSQAVAPKDPDMPADHRERITGFLHDAPRDCVSAALATIKILEILRDRGLLCHYSYQGPLYCSAALHVLLLGAKLEPPTEENKKVIVAGILILHELADGSETAASSLPVLIHGFEPFFEKKPRLDTPSTGPVNLDAMATGHRAWQAWVQGTPNPGPINQEHQQEQLMDVGSASSGYLTSSSSSRRSGRVRARRSRSRRCTATSRSGSRGSMRLSARSGTSFCRLLRRMSWAYGIFPGRIPLPVTFSRGECIGGLGDGECQRPKPLTFSPVLRGWSDRAAPWK